MRSLIDEKKNAEIEGDDSIAGFTIRDAKFVFSDGEILALKEDQIVGRSGIAEFAKRLAQIFRRLQSLI